MAEEKNDDCVRGSLKIVQRELDDLYIYKRQSEDVIKNQQHQIKILREEAEKDRFRLAENIEYWKSAYNSAYLAMQSETEKADLSTFKYFGTCALVLLATGYAVWLG